MRNARLSFQILVTAALVIGCGTEAGLDGAWSDHGQTTYYVFHPGGKVEISVLDSSVEGEYVVDGERLVITGPQGTVVLKLHDGRIEGPMGLVLHPAGSNPKFKPETEPKP